jgi:membrane protease YdiL (CAAX protease family)
MERDGPALSGGARGVLIISAVELGIFGTVFALGWLASRATREELLLRWRPGFWVVPLGIGYSIAIRLAAGVAVVAIILVMVLTGIVPKDKVEEFTMENRPQVEAVVDVPAIKNDPAYFWLSVTLVSFVVAGLREELWRSGFLAGMRGLWPRQFGSRLGQIGAVCVGAVIFGLAHIPMGALAVVITGILGLFLGLIMVLHRSIWPAVIAHGVFDATTFALLPWAMDFMKDVQKAVGH